MDTRDLATPYRLVAIAIYRDDTGNVYEWELDYTDYSILTKIDLKEKINEYKRFPACIKVRLDRKDKRGIQSRNVWIESEEDRQLKEDGKYEKRMLTIYRKALARQARAAKKGQQIRKYEQVVVDGMIVVENEDTDDSPVFEVDEFGKWKAQKPKKKGKGTVEDYIASEQGLQESFEVNKKLSMEEYLAKETAK